MNRAPLVKICCISSVLEARLAVKYGASALGLVSHMPSGPGVIDEDLIAEIVRSVPPTIATFLLTSAQSSEVIINQHRRCLTSTIQFCERMESVVHKELRLALPGVTIVQVVHVTGESSIDEAVQAAEHVDAILLDSGNPDLKIKELGGTGRVHDWSISRRIRERIPVPMFLAGGLNDCNVESAIEEVDPYGLDLCTGVRTNHVLDEAKLQAFFGVVNAC
jgi:phosphoribosylanthranilate isomerase